VNVIGHEYVRANLESCFGSDRSKLFQEHQTNSVIIEQILSLETRKRQAMGVAGDVVVTDSLANRGCRFHAIVVTGLKARGTVSSLMSTQGECRVVFIERQWHGQ
jgi:predicted HAD superfamily phosphohydrolase YqeG